MKHLRTQPTAPGCPAPQPPQPDGRLAALRTSPSKYFAALPALNIDAVLGSGEPTLGALRREEGLTVARAAVAWLVTDALEFFNVAQPMSDRQVAMTVDLILEDFPHLQTDDLKLCLRRAMKGSYGRVYNRLDGQMVLLWLREYDAERAREADRQSWNRHLAATADGPGAARTARGVGAMSYEAYRRELRRLSRLGDAEAARWLRLSDGVRRLLGANHDEANGADEELTIDS